MNLLDLVVTIKADDQASSKIEGLSTKTVAMGTAIGGTLSGMVLSGLSSAASAVKNFGEESIQTGMSFDSAMSQVAATMGLTANDIGDLTACAKEMGATTSFSATQAAEGLNYMALAGYSSEDAIATLPTVLNLAAAGTMDLGTASDMVTDAQTALGLSLEETTVMVDQMAQTSSKSNTSVQQLGDAILTVGGTAKNLSGGVTEMNTVLGLLADNGIKGSEAGTHLRNMILSLTAPTDTAAAALADLGVSATDAEGNMRPLEDVMGDFNKAFEDMTAEEKTQALNKIFNKTDLAAVNALLDTSVERWDQLGSSIEDSAGAAEKMAQTQLDNLAGDMTLLESATEGVQIELAAGATPALREMVQTGSEGLSKMAEQLRNGDIAAGFETLGQTAGNVAASFLNALPSFIDAGMKMIGGFLQGIGEAMPTVIPALVSGLVGMVSAIIENIPLFINAALQIVIGLAQGLIQAIPALVEAIPQLLTSIIDALLQSIPVIIEAGIQLFTGLVQAIPEVVVAIAAAIPEIVIAIVTALLENIPALVEGGIQLFMALVEAVPLIIETLLPMIPQIIEALANGFIEGAPQIIEAFGQMLSELPGKAQEFFSGVIEKATQWVGDMAGKAQEAGSQFLEKVVEFIQQLPGKIAEFCSNIISNVASWVSEMANNAQQAGSQFLEKVVEFIQQLPGKIAEFCSQIISNIGQWVSDMVNKAQEAGSQFFESVNQKFNEVVNFFTELPGRIINAFGDFGSMLYNVGSQIIQGLINGITSMVGNAISAVTNAVSGIVNAAKSFLGIHSPSTVFASIGDFSMQGLAKGFEEGSEEAADTLEDVLDDLSNNSVTIGANGAGKARPDRSFVFNIEINNTGQAINAGKTIGEALYQEFRRHERRTT